MDIIKHITEGLYSGQEVVISGFGKFIGERNASRVEDGTIYPPSKTVNFIRDKNSFALDLAIQVAKKERVTEDEAAKAINEFVKASNEKLKAGQSVVFEGIGIVAPKPDGSFHFHQSQHSNLLPETFGMAPVELSIMGKKARSTGASIASKKAAAAAKKKAQTSASKKNTTTTTKENKKSLAWLWWIFSIITILAISVGVWWFYFGGKDWKGFTQTPPVLKKDTNKVVKNTTIDSSKLAVKTDTVKVVTQPVEKTVTGTPAKISNSEDANKTFETHFRKNSVIYLVVGSFKNRRNADNYAAQLREDGFNSQVLSAENGFYRVTIGEFPNTSRAMRTYTKFTDKYPKKVIWAL